ncbi:MAG: hypothetical protein U9P07_11445 [Pseudomonadota bacterium]|nr:hypothetical protein [Pseudomonadota bacterium]
MEITCPACGKRNGGENNICSRCACELEKLALIVKMAGELFDEASACLRSGDGAGALEKSRLSWNLRHTGETARLAFLAALLNRDFAAASRWFKKRNFFKEGRQ